MVEQNPSPERLKYHSTLDIFISMLKPGMRVYDIGKSHIHFYDDGFRGFEYMTIDRDPVKSPCILLDVELLNPGNVEDYLKPADAILCNGVIEQCTDPMKLIRSCNAILKYHGRALFGFVLLGYPQHEFDYFRFTLNGALRAVQECGFVASQNIIVERGGIESYVYLICHKSR